jgi:hypothetical protein
MRRITFTVAAYSRPSAAFIRRYSNSGRILPGSASGSAPGQAPYSASGLPKQTNRRRSVPPPALHFRISPAYRYIYPHGKTPWGTLRSKPAQGRATFTPIVLRWRHGDGIHCPSPSPPGFPLLKSKRRGLLPPFRVASLWS